MSLEHDNGMSWPAEMMKHILRILTLVVIFGQSMEKMRPLFLFPSLLLFSHCNKSQICHNKKSTIGTFDDNLF